MKVCRLFARLDCRICIVLFLTSCNLPSPVTDRSLTALPEYWPTSAWRISAPEQQGMDSAKLETRILESFPGRTFANPDPRKQEIRLEHLLSMSYSLDWPTPGLYEPLGGQLPVARDGVQWMLDRPIASQPGAQFNYNTGGSLLLSAVLSKATPAFTMPAAMAGSASLCSPTSRWWSSL